MSRSYRQRPILLDPLSPHAGSSSQDPNVVLAFPEDLSTSPPPPPPKYDESLEGRIRHLASASAYLDLLDQLEPLIPDEASPFLEALTPERVQALPAPLAWNIGLEGPSDALLRGYRCSAYGGLLDGTMKEASQPMHSYMDLRLAQNLDWATSISRAAIPMAKRGQYDIATKEFHRAITISPQCSTAYVGRGIIFLLRREYHSAEAQFRKALQYAPEDEVAEAYLKEAQDGLRRTTAPERTPTTPASISFLGSASRSREAEERRVKDRKISLEAGKRSDREEERRRTSHDFDHRRISREHGSRDRSSRDKGSRERSSRDDRDDRERDRRRSKDQSKDRVREKDRDRRDDRRRESDRDRDRERDRERERDHGRDHGRDRDRDRDRHREREKERDRDRGRDREREKGLGRRERKSSRSRSKDRSSRSSTSPQKERLVPRKEEIESHSTSATTTVLTPSSPLPKAPLSQPPIPPLPALPSSQPEGEKAKKRMWDLSGMSMMEDLEMEVEREKIRRAKVAQLKGDTAKEKAATSAMSSPSPLPSKSVVQRRRDPPSRAPKLTPRPKPISVPVPSREVLEGELPAKRRPTVRRTQVASYQYTSDSSSDSLSSDDLLSSDEEMEASLRTSSRGVKRSMESPPSVLGGGEGRRP